MTDLAQFLKDIERHEMHVYRDDGLYRHVRFKRPGTSCMHFDLVTWPGYLAYSGDMGCFVFSRLDDMFQFFRRNNDSYRIDFRYWAEKVQGQDKGDGLREFDPAAFKRAITEQRRHLFLQHGLQMTPGQRADFWGDLGRLKDAADEGEARSVTAVQDWYFPLGGKHIHIDTSDFPSCRQYTHRFIWCCYALAWAIRKYDNERTAVPATTRERSEPEGPRRTRLGGVSPESAVRQDAPTNIRS
jgi:hypothetical protein